jgi:hypothetical protein
MRLVQSLEEDREVFTALPSVARPKLRVKSAECKAISPFQNKQKGGIRLPAPAADGHSSESFAAAGARLSREWNTMETMIRLHCRDKHSPVASLCEECHALLDYAAVRLERCRFGSEKPTCAKCPVHCYQRSRRDQIKAVMRYAGPRMLWQHPLLGLRHWFDGFRPAPKL